MNAFRKDASGNYLWPGYGDNIRVIEWILRRVNGEQKIGRETAIGIVPRESSLNVNAIDNIEYDELFSVLREFWIKTAAYNRRFFDEQVSDGIVAREGSGCEGG